MSGVRKFEQFLAYIGLQEYQDHLTNQFETLDELVDFVEVFSCSISCSIHRYP